MSLGDENPLDSEECVVGCCHLTVGATVADLQLRERDHGPLRVLHGPRHGLRCSEITCERFAVVKLEEFRALRGPTASSAAGRFQLSLVD